MNIVKKKNTKKKKLMTKKLMKMRTNQKRKVKRKESQKAIANLIKSKKNPSNHSVRINFYKWKISCQQTILKTQLTIKANLRITQKDLTKVDLKRAYLKKKKKKVKSKALLRVNKKRRWGILQIYISFIKSCIALRS